MEEETYNPMYTPSKKWRDQQGYKYRNGLEAIKAASKRINGIKKARVKSRQQTKVRSR